MKNLCLDKPSYEASYVWLQCVNSYHHQS